MGLRDRCLKFIFPFLFSGYKKRFGYKSFIEYMIDDEVTLTNYMAYDKVTKTFLPEYEKRFDYCRFRALELIAEEIYRNNIEGNVAEAGVARGNFAQFINKCFHDKKLYLYDTFEGFNENDKKKELEMNYTSLEWFKMVNDYKLSGNADTNIKTVYEKMTYKDNCIFRKGYFPESAINDTNERFAFVSIDMDLYQPICNALKFFYPRLSPGGYIFLHDYNSTEYKGIKIAVKEFETENGRLHKTPLPDQGGTLVISKLYTTNNTVLPQKA